MTSRGARQPATQAGVTFGVTETYVTLRAISSRSGVTVQRVRALERAGLISPAVSTSELRLYREDTVERIRQIERLTRDLGVNLAGVEVILHMRERIIELLEHSGGPTGTR